MAKVWEDIARAEPELAARAEERSDAYPARAPHQRRDPALGDTVGVCDLAAAAPLQYDRVDDEASEVHWTPPW